MRSFGTPTSKPEFLGFIVAGDFAHAFEDGRVELFGIDAEPVFRSDEFPGVGDGVLLEVVAKAEVAEHLEEGVMAVGEADVFEVVVLASGADAFLRGSGAGVVAVLEAEEDVFELVHAGVGEEQRGVVGRDERGGVDDFVALLLKEAQKHGANVGTGRDFTGHKKLGGTVILTFGRAVGRRAKATTETQRRRGNRVKIKGNRGLGGGYGFSDDPTQKEFE